MMSFVLAATDIIVVTTPEPTAITDAYGLLKIIHQRAGHAKVRLVVNMAKSPAEAETVAERLNSVLREFVRWEVEYADIFSPSRKWFGLLPHSSPYCCLFHLPWPVGPLSGSPGCWRVKKAPANPWDLGASLPEYLGFCTFREGMICSSYLINLWSYIWTVPEVLRSTAQGWKMFTMISLLWVPLWSGVLWCPSASGQK